MSFNYRIVQLKDGDDIFLAIHTAYYEDDVLVAISEEPEKLGYWDNAGDLADELEKFKSALDKPVVTAEEVEAFGK